MIRVSFLAVLLVPRLAVAELPPRTVTLDDAVAAARAHHPQLAERRAQTEAARARADQAKAALFPQVVARVTGQHTEREAQGTVVGTTVSGDFVQASVGLNQLIYDFGQTGGRWGAAEQGALAQAETARATENDVVLAVRTVFFEARANRALVDVARETLSNQERHLGQIETFIDVGARPEIDRAQSRTEVANARLALIRAENGYAAARARLNQAMGLEESPDFEVTNETLAMVAGEDGATDSLLEEAMHNRAELAALRAARAGQDETLRALRGQYYPSIAVSATAAESGAGFDSLGWSLVGALSVTWPIFEGWRTRAAVHETEWTRSAVDAQLAAERQTLRLEAEQARLAVRGAKSALVAAGEALTNARDRLRLAEGRYQTGVGNVIELGDAQVALTNAAAQVVQAEYDLATARAQMLHVLGRF